MGPARQTHVSDRIMDRDMPAIERKAPLSWIEFQENLLAASAKAEMDDRTVFRRDVQHPRPQLIGSGVDEFVLNLSDLGHQRPSV
jgi:hypothetical protein